jgi:hypothetical protein
MIGSPATQEPSILVTGPQYSRVQNIASNLRCEKDIGLIDIDNISQASLS